MAEKRGAAAERLYEALRLLRTAGKPNTAKIYARHGVREESWGVPYGALAKQVKQLGMDHPLALALWETGVHDARVLATKLADPEAFARGQLEAWIAASPNYIANDALSALAARRDDALALAGRWIGQRAEWQQAAGWNVIAILATDARIERAAGAALLARILETIHDAPNRARHSMNNALIALGGGVPGLRAQAQAAAKRIGRVEVDHGETGCKTPDAASYLARIAPRRGAAAPKRTRVTGARMRG
jgi:3-methyladenine DNA glycosylase AlkD